MKIIFLDIDGVLNSMQYIIRLNGLFDRPENQMDPEAVVRLNRLTDATGAKLVISSTWRIPFLNEGNLDALSRMIRSYKITAEVVGMTPRKFTSNRAQEISIWLHDTDLEVEQYVIIDDSVSDLDGLEDRLVATKFNDGIQDEHVEKAIALLK